MMKNRILLVDDEKTFLTSLKEGLEELGDDFSVDICFSVDEAEKLIKKNKVDLIITDIRMPKRSGIDLLIYLKEINFKGGIKVMSAYSTGENIKKIEGLGVVDIISKPFNLSWFGKMILDFFEVEKDIDATFESINLLSVLQVINIDKKNAVVRFSSENNKGLIYFNNGEIVNAEFGGLKGEKALVNILKLKTGNISVKKSKLKTKKTINVPFTPLIMNILKTLDEIKISEGKIKKKLKKRISLNNKEDEMALKNVLKSLSNDVNGLQAASIFGKDGLSLAMINPMGLDVDAFSAKFMMVTALVSKTVRDLSNGNMNEIIIEEDEGWTIIRPVEKSDLSLFISVSREATLGNLRLVAKKIATEVSKLA